MACRLSRNELLSNRARAHLYRTIVDQPGIPFLGLLASLRAEPALASGAGHGMLMHHLYVLERFHLVVSRKEGRYRRYFQNGGTFGRATAQIALVLAEPVGRISWALWEHPGSAQQELLQRLGTDWPCTRQSLAYHLRRLERGGLVEVRRRGSHKEYYPTGDLGRAIAFVEGAGKAREFSGVHGLETVVPAPARFPPLPPMAVNESLTGNQIGVD